jgi:hypothetical protein
MRDPLPDTAGERLLGDDYLADFEEHFWRTGETGFWKLERLQHFLEPTDDSWTAFAQGRWQDALELLEQRRPSLIRHYEKISDHHFTTWRIRVVEHPLSDYMRWELRLLRLRDELGGHTRIIDVEQIRKFEADGVLPELVTLGDDVAYRLLYDENGLQEGGVRFTQNDVVVRCREFIQSCYDQGEPIDDYFAREIATVESGS